jgi:hypothetical protein
MAQALHQSPGLTEGHYWIASTHCLWQEALLSTLTGFPNILSWRPHILDLWTSTIERRTRGHLEWYLRTHGDRPWGWNLMGSSWFQSSGTGVAPKDRAALPSRSIKAHLETVVTGCYLAFTPSLISTLGDQRAVITSAAGWVILLVKHRWGPTQATPLLKLLGVPLELSQQPRSQDHMLILWASGAV